MKHVLTQDEVMGIVSKRLDFWINEVDKTEAIEKEDKELFMQMFKNNFEKFGLKDVRKIIRKIDVCVNNSLVLRDDGTQEESQELQEYFNKGGCDLSCFDFGREGDTIEAYSIELKKLLVFRHNYKNWIRKNQELRHFTCHSKRMRLEKLFKWRYKDLIKERIKNG